MIARALPVHHIGGMEAVAWDLARALAALGARVHVLTTPCAALAADTVREGVRVTTLPGASGAYSTEWAESLRKAWKAHLCRDTDVVLSVSAGAFPLLGMKGDVPFVMQAHGTSWGEVLSKIAQRTPLAWAKAAKNLMAMRKDLAYRHFDGIVAVGDVTARQLRQRPTRLLVGATPVHLILNGIDTSAFAYSPEGRALVRSRLNVPSGAPVVLSSSRLHVQKGIAESLLGVARAIAVRPDLRYLIVGEGPAEAELRVLASTLRIEKSVNFCGAVDREKLKDLLSAADVFLFTSLRQEVGVTLSTLEALSTGLPCITAGNQSGETLGLIDVAPRDPQAIATAILDVLALPPDERRCLLPDSMTLNHAATAYLKLFSTLSSRRSIQSMTRSA